MTRSRETHTFWWITALVVVTLVATWLRTQQLVAQVLLDDEWHSLHTIFRHDYREIALSFGRFDHSIPLTLSYQAIANAFGLDELRMRLPSLVAGVTTVILGMWWSWRRFGPPTAVIFGWLLAISPLLVIYSRAARPYALVVLLVLVAFWAAHIWWYQHRPTFLWLYAVCVAIGTWLHPLFGPVLLSPLLFFALDSAWTQRRLWPSVHLQKRLLNGGVIVALLTAPLVLPPLLADPSAILDKAGVGTVAPHTLPAVTYLMAGTSHFTVLLLAIILSAVGTILLLRREPRKVFFALLVLVIFATTLAVSRPAWMSTGYVMARYTIILLPWLLLAVALASTTIATRLTKQLRGRNIVMVAIALLLAWGNPLTETLRTPVSHGLHPYYIADARPDARRINMLVERMPQSPFWKNHAALLSDADSALALAPWRFEAPLSPLPVLEHRTGRRVIPAFINGYCATVHFGEPPAESPVQLRNALHLGQGERSDAKAGFLVWKRRWHIDTEAEQTLADMGLYTDPLTLAYPDCEPQLRLDFGPPVYEDEWLAVFPL